MTNSVTAYAPFPSPDVRLLRNDEFSHVLSFFKLEELLYLERVCTSWKKFIETSKWKKQCDYFIGISTDSDRLKFFPQCATYKNILQLVLPKILDQETYRYYLGAEIGPVPPIPEEISLKRFIELDPCQPTETIGQNYFWVYFPAYFEIIGDEDFPFELEKEADPNAEEAPMLIIKEGEKSEEKRVLKIPNTINNITKLFKHPKKGNPSHCSCIRDQISLQHGNKRMVPGWMCMREKPIGKNLSISQQQEAANKAGVVITSLLHRMNFNFLEYVRKKVCPDENNAPTYARTSTLIQDWGHSWFPSCGEGRSILPITKLTKPYSNVGAAVAFPTKVQPSDN
ncbi:MAG TPA: hypothetical protein VLG49_06780 [Rhabdochlamydiaceae bacterium]|nr:hypothetical protein [Rhabdochlamydiaceae bacterium]